MKVWTYSIMLETIPTGRVSWFLDGLTRAFRYIESASGEAVKFIDSATLAAASRLALHVSGHVNIGFDETVTVGQQWSNKTPDGRVIHSLAFEPAADWSTKWWHKWFTKKKDLMVVAVHEIGHLLGLEHNILPWDESVMTEGARFHEFSPREIEYLRRLSIAVLAAFTLTGCTGMELEPSLTYTGKDGKSVSASLVIRTIEVEQDSGK